MHRLNDHYLITEIFCFNLSQTCLRPKRFEILVYEVDVVRKNKSVDDQLDFVLHIIIFLTQLSKEIIFCCHYSRNVVGLDPKSQQFFFGCQSNRISANFTSTKFALICQKINRNQEHNWSTFKHFSK